MKKQILTILCLMLCSSPLFSQDEETLVRKFLGGTFNVSFSNNSVPGSVNGVTNPGILNSQGDNASNNTVSINPYFGKSVSRFWDAGFQISSRVRSSSAEYQNFIFNPSGPTQTTYLSESNTIQIGLGLFARYNFMPDKNFNIFTQPFIQYNISNQKNKNDGMVTIEQKTNFLQVGVGLGAAYQFSNRLAALVNFGNVSYYNGSWKNEADDIKHNFSSFNMNFNAANFFLGIEFRL